MSEVYGKAQAELKRKERERQDAERAREAAARALVEACQADGGHVYNRNGYCVGCREYNALYAKEAL